MTKFELANRVREKVKISPATSLKVIDTALDIIMEELIKGNEVCINRFGRFYNKKRRPKIARHINDNIPMYISAHYMPAFSPARKFREAVRENVKLEK